MRTGSKSNCKSTSHLLFKDRARNWVDDLQGVFVDLQFARKESRSRDVMVLEEQVHQMIREWKSELNGLSPSASLPGDNSIGLFSADIGFFLERPEVEDDATSALTEPAALKPDPDAKGLKDSFVNCVLEEDFDELKNPSLGFAHNSLVNNMGVITPWDYNLLDLNPNFNSGLFSGADAMGQYVEDAVLNIPGFLENICCPPPSAFLGPRCALWDCSRPALQTEWCPDYCNGFHSALALNEGSIGRAPVVRPGGIDLKDGPLFLALTAKTQGKDVGIPECEGAATTKSPWNASELFDLLVLKGEMIREWLFFDKPRRAFESGNRKQRSLPDYRGRGWHESRKQVVDEFGGLKRSYYMDPQPQCSFEWHLYEYEINHCDACALYRLEFKRVDGKKNPKTKGTASESVADLQRQMKRLSADTKGTMKVRTDAAVGYGPGGYLGEDMSGYYNF